MWEASEPPLAVPAVDGGSLAPLYDMDDRILGYELWSKLLASTPIVVPY